MAGRRSADCVVPWPTGETDSDRLLVLLGKGTIELAGLMPWSSNYTFLGSVADASGAGHPVIYKPTRGARPLWDFPAATLAKREVAAYVVCRALGWNLVPPTVLRGGPHGRGSVQLYVDVDPDAHFFSFRDDPQYLHALQALALFDLIANNADRKGGHCLSTGDGCIVAIDHGLCFHEEPKLRTVIWDFSTEPIPDDLLADARRFAQELSNPESATLEQLKRLLSGAELSALRHRLDVVIEAGTYPAPPEDRRPYPWPLV